MRAWWRPAGGAGRTTPQWLTALVVLAASSAACSSAATAGGAHRQPGRSVPVAPAASSAPPTAPSPTPFASSVSVVTASDLGGSWHSGCPVDPSQLRALQLSYWGFDGRAHSGTMVVNASVVEPVAQVFGALYAARFPISQIVPMSAFNGDDDAAAAADNTSGFDCRNAVAPGPPRWSVHAYGEAIDVNDVQNPYVSGPTVIPPAGSAYLDRADVRPGMAVLGGTLVDAFSAVGWYWGGRWSGAVDYQHFSVNGH